MCFKTESCRNKPLQLFFLILSCAVARTRATTTPQLALSNYNPICGAGGPGSDT